MIFRLRTLCALALIVHYQNKLKYTIFKIIARSDFMNGKLDEELDNLKHKKQKEILKL